MSSLNQIWGHGVARLAGKFLAAAIISLAALPAAAQTTLPPAPSAARAPAPPQKARRFGVTTTFDVRGDRDRVFEPLTPGEKFAIFYKNAYSPLRILSAGFSAGIDQAENQPKEYGQGAEGYGKRLGASMADAASSEFFGRFLLPTMLHQDPRYYRRYETGFRRRLRYALTRVLVTRTDSGGRAFNYSQVGGALAAAGISNLYYPDEERGAGLTFSRFGFAIGAAAAVNFGREFWPDIAHKLFHHGNNPPPPAGN